MGIWDVYEARLGVSDRGLDSPQHKVAHNRTHDRLNRKVVSSLSCESIEIDGVHQEISIVDVADDLYTKKIFSLPGESLPHGSVLNWKDEIWLITEVNTGHGVYEEGRMRRCNYNLKWIDDAGNLITKWCVVEDGTKLNCTRQPQYSFRVQKCA